MNYLMIIARRILTNIFGPVQERDGWRIRTNLELNKLIGGNNTVRFIKAQRLKWWSHLHRTVKVKQSHCRPGVAQRVPGR
jgi:hypothetical protein